MLIRDTLGPAYEMHKATMLQQNLPMLPPATAAVTVKAVCFLHVFTATYVVLAVRNWFPLSRRA